LGLGEVYATQAGALTSGSGATAAAAAAAAGAAAESRAGTRCCCAGAQSALYEASGLQSKYRSN
jgi:hypothetical protein